MALTNAELDAVALFGGLFSQQTWASLYSLVLERPVTVEEVTDAHERLYARYWREHPAEKALHDKRIAEFAQMQPALETFWRGDGWKR